jgi:hypothetical protein
MPNPGHLGLEVSAEAVVTVTVVALILGNPRVLVWRAASVSLPGISLTIGSIT